jgi:hypothetical protein
MPFLSLSDPQAGNPAGPLPPVEIVRPSTVRFPPGWIAAQNFQFVANESTIVEIRWRGPCKRPQAASSAFASGEFCSHSPRLSSESPLNPRYQARTLFPRRY